MPATFNLIFRRQNDSTVQQLMEFDEEKKYTQKDLDEVRKRANYFEDEYLKMFRLAGFQKVVVVVLVFLVGTLLVCWGIMVQPREDWLAYLGLAVWTAIIIWALKSNDQKSKSMKILRLLAALTLCAACSALGLFVVHCNKMKTDHLQNESSSQLTAEQKQAAMQKLAGALTLMSKGGIPLRDGVQTELHNAEIFGGIKGLPMDLGVIAFRQPSRISRYKLTYTAGWLLKHSPEEIARRIDEDIYKALQGKQ